MHAARRVPAPPVGQAGKRPASVGIRRERVEAAGAVGPTTWTGSGRLSRRDERPRQALRCIPRSLVSAAAVAHACPGGAGRPLGGAERGGRRAATGGS